MKKINGLQMLIVFGCMIVLLSGCGGSSGDGDEAGTVDSGGEESSVAADDSNDGDSVSVQTKYYNNFDQNPVGAYSVAMLQSDWRSPAWSEGITEGRVYIVDGGEAYSGNSLRVLYPAGEYSNGSGALWEMQLDGSYDELYCSYKVKFGENLGFDFSKGGKLPGLGGGSTPTGGGIPSGYDGWTARIMWRDFGSMYQYVYYPEQTGTYGEYMDWGVSATPGVWHDLKVRIVMNTPNVRDGILEAWFDGVKVLYRNDIMYRKTDSFAIDSFLFNTFYGGGDSSWAPDSDQYIYFDEFSIYQN